MAWESEPPLQITLPSSDPEVLSHPSLGSNLELTVYKWDPNADTGKTKHKSGTFMGRVVLQAKEIAELLEQQTRAPGFIRDYGLCDALLHRPKRQRTRRGPPAWATKWTR